MKKIYLVQLLLGLFAAASPSLQGFTLPLLLYRTRQSSSSSSSSSSFPCFLIRSTSTTGTISHNGKMIPFFATVVPTISSSSSSLLTTDESVEEDSPDDGASSSSNNGVLFDNKKPTKSVYEKTPVSKHIMLTDYLRNPRSLQRTATAAASSTTTSSTSPKPVVQIEESKQQQQQQPITSITLSASSALLEEAISTFDNAAAKQILAKLTEMRRDNNNDATTDPSSAIATLLDGLLERGPDQPATTRRLPRWTQWRFLTRFSKRARLASLRRTLDLVTPPTMSASESSRSKDQDNADDVESKKRRRRRAFVSILNTLAKPLDGDDNGKKQQKRSRRHGGLPAIAVLEKKARREQRQGSLLQQGDDLILRRPQNLETPKYTIVAKRRRSGGHGFEIRHYEPYSLCSVNMAKARPPDSYKMDAVISEPKLKGASSFGALAGYLFGKNQQETAMKMTTPVFTTLNSNDDDAEDDANAAITARRRRDETMSFVLPSEFWKDNESLSLAPQPLEGSGVTLERIEGGHRAVVMFGGYATKENVAQRKRELLQKLDKDPDWRVIVAATAAAAASSSSNVANESSSTDDRVVGNMSDHGFALAQYNDPFTPPWKRLNEISIAVERR